MTVDHNTVPLATHEASPISLLAGNNIKPAPKVPLATTRYTALRYTRAQLNRPESECLSASPAGLAQAEPTTARIAWGDQ